MINKKFLPIILFILFYAAYVNAQESVVWNIDRTDSIGGYLAEKLPQYPIISKEKSAMFNGKDQALLVHGNPLGDASAFTIEVIIKPDSSLNPGNLEQRYFHLGESKGAKPRILMELRLLKNQKWALDTYLGSENSSSTYLDTVNTDKLHPAGQWYNITLVYENNKVTDYVNGVKEFTGDVEFHALPKARISIGARQDPKSWFNGSIKAIRFTKRALKPAEFMK